MPAIGPVPFCGMLLADLGADVLRIDRLEASNLGLSIETRYDLLGRGKRSLALDLKAARSRELLLQLAGKADVLIEGFRPGTMERLGLGPELILERNPRLVYGRMTGWGQQGPMAQAAGHDINYIALSGVLHACGNPGGKPVPPVNLLGDFGGGTLYLMMGLLAALYERQHSGQGQVVDSAMVDGSASLTTLFHGMLAQGAWRDARGENEIDSGAPWYDTYECADGRYVAVGALENKFFAILVERLGLDQALVANQLDRAEWPAMRQLLAHTFRGKTRDEWCRILEGTDACFAPVLSMREAPAHPHMGSRRTFEEHFGVLQPAAAPRLSRTPGRVQGPAPAPGEGGCTAAREWGVECQDAM
jgi:alpha-methylacyl-CoA racemase